MGKITIVSGLPPKVKKGEMVAMDIEMFRQEVSKLHRPHGIFACITICLERDDNTVYIVQDTKDLKKVFELVSQGIWVLHNAMYDFKQLSRWVELKDRFVWDTMLVDQSQFGGYYTNFGLKDLARRYLGVVMDKETRENFEKMDSMTADMIKYAADDASLTLKIAVAQRLTLEDGPGWKAYETDQRMMFPLLEINGATVDVESWQKAIASFQSTADKLQNELGFNVYSPVQVIKALKSHGLNLANTQAKTLAEYADVPVVKQLMEARMYRKATSTYGTKWLENYVEEDGKVYSSWNITGAETGRMSCVSGSTILNTNRGPFRIEDYIPKYGDTILTHAGRHKPIVRKIYKGEEEFVQVECSNGSVVQCTLSHKLQTPTGWVEVRDLYPSSEVISNVNLNSIRDQQREYQESPAYVFGGRPQVWLSADSGRYSNNLSQRSIHSEQVRRRGAKEHGAEHPDVSFQDGNIKSGTSETSSQLQGEHRGRAWIHSEEGERKVCTGTSKSNGGGAGIEVIAEGTGSASHRREQTEQRHRQSGTGYGCGTSETTYKSTRITKITALGTMGVWDIEVADDHSYVAGGLVHHNSSKPNGQNIPARKMPIYRTFFVPSPGGVMVVDDVSQQEPCILAYESKDPILTAAIKAGEDLHQAVADAIHMERSIGKAINLGIGYGLSAHGLSTRVGITETEAEAIITNYFSRFSGVFRWIQSQRDYGRKNGYVKTSSTGRRIYLNTHSRQWQNNAINAPIQGGAADFTKHWVRNYWEACHDMGIPYSLCMIVHDELVMDVPKQYLKKNREAIDRAFYQTSESLFPGIPFRFELEQGRSWACKQMSDEIWEDDEEGEDE